jgi:hypothetical protein
MSAEPVLTGTDVDSSAVSRTVARPYMSFPGFRNLLDRLGRDGVPQVLDKSFFRQSSGSLVAQIRGSLRYLDLIDEEKRPTPTLIRLAKADEQERIPVLRQIAEDKYGDAIALGVDATHGQLADVFRTSGLSGSSLNKAVTFYVGFAEYVGLPLSPYFKQGAARPSNGSSTTPRRSSRRRKSTAVSEASPASTQAPPPPIEVKKSAYIDLLMKLVESGAASGEVQTDLLDRLELALGYRTPVVTQGTIADKATGTAPSEQNSHGAAPGETSGSEPPV